MRRLALSASLAAVLAALLVTALPAGASRERLPRENCGAAKHVPIAVRKSAKVVDYIPIKPNLTVRPNACITWKWSATNSDSHNVALRQGPRKVKKFHSALAVTDYSYSRYLTTKGTYRIWCTLHPQMTQRIVVR